MFVKFIENAFRIECQELHVADDGKEILTLETGFRKIFPGVFPNPTYRRKDPERT